MRGSELFILSWEVQMALKESIPAAKLVLGPVWQLLLAVSSVVAAGKTSYTAG